MSWLAEYGSVIAMVLCAGCFGAIVIGIFAGGAAIQNSQDDARRQIEVPIPPPRPVLRDIPHPERYPKTWAYRAKVGAEETTEITPATDDPFGDQLAVDWYLRSGDPTPTTLRLMDEYQRGRRRRVNGEEL